jgi:hypothetical protein
MICPSSSTLSQDLSLPFEFTSLLSWVLEPLRSIAPTYLAHLPSPECNALSLQAAVRSCEAEKQKRSGSSCSSETEKRLRVWEAHIRGVLDTHRQKLGRRIIHNVDAQAVPDSTFSASTPCQTSTAPALQHLISVHFQSGYHHLGFGVWVKSG